ncbi:hypothetical protein DCS_04049 [Drechmeria coniospora]|uniref:Uncharacterized protein n=1 Tax=Drechmeria coniospora TaxID=98403 RepID=A0A151GJ44_DRECN|nr:hypothetical protein DCS_04049 [Drechmeria coniospora]KYK57042.1 hypothetical protein DCS_04049 [Drechmeria coniospora]ODA78946.1 hypothetical protein RJ55_04536 [Drechmeria coniospora]
MNCSPNSANPSTGDESLKETIDDLTRIFDVRYSDKTKLISVGNAIVTILSKTSFANITTATIKALMFLLATWSRAVRRVFDDALLPITEDAELFVLKDCFEDACRLWYDIEWQ